MQGTGAFALPRLFYKAGLILSTLFLIVVALCALMSISFIMEGLSTTTVMAHFTKRLLKGRRAADVEGVSCNSDQSGRAVEIEMESEAIDAPLLGASEASHQSAPTVRWVDQHGTISTILLPKWGKILWFVTIVTYLYGAFVSLSMFTASLTIALQVI